MTTPKTTGFNSNTHKHLVLDAGAIYLNYGEENETLLGATQGGGTFNATPEWRNIAVDGVKGRAMGMSLINAWEVSLSASMLEITPENLKLALGVADITTGTDGETVIKGRNNVLPTDYVKNVTWVGKLSGAETPVIIKVLNALSETGLSLTTADNTEGLVPLEFFGHIDPLSATEPPFEIIYPNVTI